MRTCEKDDAARARGSVRHRVSERARRQRVRRHERLLLRRQRGRRGRLLLEGLHERRRVPDGAVLRDGSREHAAVRRRVHVDRARPDGLHRVERHRSRQDVLVRSGVVATQAPAACGTSARRATTDADCLGKSNQVCADGGNGEKICTVLCDPAVNSCPWGNSTAVRRLGQEARQGHVRASLRQLPRHREELRAVRGARRLPERHLRGRAVHERTVLRGSDRPVLVSGRDHGNLSWRRLPADPRVASDEVLRRQRLRRGRRLRGVLRRGRRSGGAL